MRGATGEPLQPAALAAYLVWRVTGNPGETIAVLAYAPAGLAGGGGEFIMRLSIAVLACLGLSCCLARAAEPSWDVSGRAPKGKTKSLFEGKTLDGWTQIPPNTWEVKDGTMAS